MNTLKCYLCQLEAPPNTVSIVERNRVEVRESGGRLRNVNITARRIFCQRCYRQHLHDQIADQPEWTDGEVHLWGQGDFSRTYLEKGRLKDAIDRIDLT